MSNYSDVAKTTIVKLKALPLKDQKTLDRIDYLQMMAAAHEKSPKEYTPASGNLLYRRK